MTAEIISIGDELLIGQVINTNQAFIAGQLDSIGIAVETMTTVGDEESRIIRAFERALAEHEVVVVTGGLGPTHDDLTRPAVCRFFQTDLIVDQAALENIRQLFGRRGLAVTPLNEDQARVPRGCTVIQNRHGTAPGYFFERGGKYMAVLPGVPFEMKAMMEEFVVPSLKPQSGNRIIRHKTLKTTGIAESHLADLIGPMEQHFAASEGLSLAFLPSPMGVRLRITARGTDEGLVNSLIERVKTSLVAKAGKYVYGEGDEELEHIVGRLLAAKKLTIAVAESCTGGLIADRLTNVPGSSSYFERGLITYSNVSKTSELGVPESVLESHGAVSRETAEAMASGVRLNAGTDIGISTTGVAGPTGGSADKPVGLVWIGYSDGHETIALKFNFGDDRRRTKERASQAALELLRRKLLKVS
jgi:nicotinamide-nucleotide amidase